MYMYTLLTGTGGRYQCSITSYWYVVLALMILDYIVVIIELVCSMMVVVVVLDSVEEAYWFVLLPGHLCWYLKYMSRFSRVGIQSSPKNLRLRRAMVT